MSEPTGPNTEILLRLSQCLGALPWLEGIGSTVVISVFFIGYFYVLNHPAGATRR